MKVRTLDYHTAGEPLRIVISGMPEIPGESMLARRQYMRDQLDHYRRFLMLEPRGHADMYGAVMTPPISADGDVGVLFLHNEGYSTMCGHGIIALVTAGLEHGLFPVGDPDHVRIDTPAGRISARANLDADGRVDSVSFRNVASFVLEEILPVKVAGLTVQCTIAFGGAFYAYIDAREYGFELVPPEAPRLIRLGRQIKQAVSEQYSIFHPDGDEALNFLYGTVFVLQSERLFHSRNACVFADGELDRSPTGTGVSGRAAIHYARGDIGLGQDLFIDSIIGSSFRVRCLEESRAGSLQAVIPEVTGSAHISGRHEFFLDEMDPLSEGFMIR